MMAHDSEPLISDVACNFNSADMPPIVSIIVPCYKQAHFLPVTLASVQSQSLKDWECLIINDGSPDDTESVAKSWVEKDERFRYFSKENGGLPSARNFGLVHARGRFIQFLDSDDVILPNKLELQVQQLSANQSHCLSFCDYKLGSENDIYTPPDSAVYLPPILDEVTTVYELAADWETRLSIPAHCFLFNKAFFDQGIMFNEALANHEDWDCWMQIFNISKNIYYCPEKLAIYRYRPDSMCRSLGRNLVKMKEGYLQAIDYQLNNNSYSRELKAILRVKRAEINLIARMMLDSDQSFVTLLKILVKKIINRMRRL
jgi:glycosyltransferase involved in cell wall biosynthesis